MYGAMSTMSGRVRPIVSICDRRLPDVAVLMCNPDPRLVPAPSRNAVAWRRKDYKGRVRLGTNNRIAADRVRRGLALVAALITLPFLAAAAQIAPESEVVPDTTVRLARERAIAVLEARLRAIPAGTATLGDWITAAADRDRDFRALLWSLPATDSPQWIGDDVCLSRVEIDQATLQRALDAWAAEAPRLPAEAFPNSHITAVGGARRGDQSAAFLEDRQMLARQAAAMSACRELLDQIRRLKLTATQRVSVWLDAEERRDAQFLVAIRENAHIDFSGGDDAVAHAGATLGLDEIILLLTRHARARGGESPDFIAIADLNPVGQLRAFGWAAPPSIPPFRHSLAARRAALFDRVLRVAAYVPAESLPPAWSGEIPPEAWAALREAVRDVPFRGANVSGYLFVHPECEARIEALLTAAAMVERIEACDDGGEEWTLSLALAWLAEAIGEG
jgi:hypothetical protein